MFGYSKLLDTIIDKVAALTDPEDESADPHPIYQSVISGRPSKLSFYRGPGAVILLSNASNVVWKGMRKQHRVSVVQGAVLTFIPGDDDQAMHRCLHYSDIVGGLFDDRYILGIPGSWVEPVASMAQGWRIIDLTKAIDLSTGQLTKTTTAATFFNVHKNHEKVEPEPEPEPGP